MEQTCSTLINSLGREQGCGLLGRRGPASAGSLGVGGSDPSVLSHCSKTPQTRGLSN